MIEYQTGDATNAFPQRMDSVAIVIAHVVNDRGGWGKGFVAGLGVLYKKKWGVPVALVVGILNILCFPLGTALGAYSIWIFTKLNEKPPEEPKFGYA